MMSDEGENWRGVDEGWGRLAVDFATLSEPANCRIKTWDGAPKLPGTWIAIVPSADSCVTHRRSRSR